MRCIFYSCIWETGTNSSVPVLFTVQSPLLPSFPSIDCLPSFIHIHRICPPPSSSLPLSPIWSDLSFNQLVPRCQSPPFSPPFCSSPLQRSSYLCDRLSSPLSVSVVSYCFAKSSPMQQKGLLLHSFYMRYIRGEEHSACCLSACLCISPIPSTFHCRVHLVP